jgi:hypothetical protein
MPIPKYPDNTNWDKINAREYFSKTLNSLIIGNNQLPKDERRTIDDMLIIAEQVVKKMFALYTPDKPIENKETTKMPS